MSKIKVSVIVPVFNVESIYHFISSNFKPNFKGY